MKNTITLIALFLAIIVNAQTSYNGYLGKQPITMVLLHYSDGVSIGYYAYDKHDTPITFKNGTLKNNTLRFEEWHDNTLTGSLLFNNFNETNKTVTGKWINENTKKSYPITLTKDFEINTEEGAQAFNLELLQSQSTKNHYFKTILRKDNENYYHYIEGVNIYEKKTDRLVQSIPLECQSFGIDNVSVDDYNFDGTQDFSVFEASYSGPNTSSIYILRNPESETYFVSDFGGTSLEFDTEKKRIYERNQCCAGSQITTAEYKVVNNKMVLLKQECWQYNHDTEEHDLVKCE